MNIRNSPAVTPAETSGYLNLRERAVQILAEAPDALDASALAQRLFGAGSGERWVALLPTVLAGDERLHCVDGHWRLKRRRANSRLPTIATTVPPDLSRTEPVPAQAHDDRIVALALATTGADPRRHRIARIVVVLYEDGEIRGRFDAVVNSGHRLSRYVRDAAGVVAEDLDQSPSFADAMEGLGELLDGRTVYAYGARRAQAFLDAELRRAELPPLDGQIVELDTLIAPLLPGARKPGLFAAAEELGIPHNGRGSPLADAELSARVVARVRERLAASPPRPSLVDEPPSLDPARPLPFTRAWLSSVPEGPGVYIFEDETGQALYVGKAVSLHRRLSAYVGRQPSLHRRLEGLAVRAATVATIAAPSDLEATLLEARLIRERQPTFNVARATRPPTTIVRAAPDARSPSVRLVGEIAADGARYLGPFESVSAARKAMSVARAAYPDAFARRRGDVDRQRQAVLEVSRLLSGQKQPTLAMLRASMQAAASESNQPEVDRLREALRDVQTLSTRPSDLAGLADGWRLLVLERLLDGGPGRVHLLQDGRLIGSKDTDRSTLPTDPAHLLRFADEMFGTSEDSEAEEDEVSWPDSWSPEDTTILLRWLAQARSRLEIQRLPAAEDVALD